MLVALCRRTDPGVFPSRASFTLPHTPRARGYPAIAIKRRLSRRSQKGAKRSPVGLQAYLDSRESDMNRWLFKSQKTNFPPNSLQQLFAKIYKEAGIKGAKSHSGRRTFDTRLIEKGCYIKSVSVLMGHSNIQTTAKYVSENPVRLAEMVADL